MKIIVTLKSDEIIEISTLGYISNQKISDTLANNSNHIFFNEGFDKNIMIMKDSIKTIEIREV